MKSPARTSTCGAALLSVHGTEPYPLAVPLAGVVHLVKCCVEHLLGIRAPARRGP